MVAHWNVVAFLLGDQVDHEDLEVHEGQEGLEKQEDHLVLAKLDLGELDLEDLVLGELDLEDLDLEDLNLVGLEFEDLGLADLDPEDQGLVGREDLLELCFPLLRASLLAQIEN